MPKLCMDYRILYIYTYRYESRRLRSTCVKQTLSNMWTLHTFANTKYLQLTKLSLELAVPITNDNEVSSFRNHSS